MVNTQMTVETGWMIEKVYGKWEEFKKSDGNKTLKNNYIEL